jgi:hypothetical protein
VHEKGLDLRVYEDCQRGKKIIKDQRQNKGREMSGVQILSLNRFPRLTTIGGGRGATIKKFGNSHGVSI